MVPARARFLPLALACTLAAAAQKQPLPQPTPYPPAITTPEDTPYVGPVKLSVDLSNNADRIAQVHEEIAVEKGAKELVLLYPQWIPGTHSPTGPISKLGGITTTVDGKRVQWVRDTVDVYAFHVPLTPGAKTVGLDFQYLSPVKHEEGRIEISNEIADLAWNRVLMYPAGHFARQIPFDVSLKLPEGWKYATALETATNNGANVTFKTTPLHTLVDSPLYGGINYKRVDLSPSPTNKVYLDVFADKPEQLEITPDELDKHKKLTIEADKLYQSHHYDHYDFLLLLSDRVGGVGLEHHQSSEDGHPGNYFTDWASGVGSRDLLGHEYTHSWDGKFRRPAELWTPNFNVPMRDELLWVYEGMTQYWGNILTARAGMRTPDEARSIFALDAAEFEASQGRTWRPLVDTTNQPTISQRRPVSWVSWQRPEDYYTEGALIWLDADTKIRELTGGAKSLDDFAKLFFGVYNGSYITDTYTLDDVVHDLNAVAPYDWKAFLQTRVFDLHAEVPEDGFTRGGYKLTYSDAPIPWLEKLEARSGYTGYEFSLGFSIGSRRHGGSASGSAIGSVYWGSPAFKAGVTPDMELVSVDGAAYTPEALKKALIAAEKTKTPIQLQFLRGDEYKTIAIDYHGGLRYPHLERVANTPARFDDILAPSKAALPAM